MTAVTCRSGGVSNVRKRSDNSSANKREREKQKRTPSSFFVPRSDRQREYCDLLRAPNPSIVVATGPAGTAKTFGAVMVGLEKLRAGEVSRMVLTRPAVGADEDLGFLPGDLEDKMRAWLLPVVDALRVYMSPEEVERMLETSAGGRIEICSLAHMRGRTLRDAYVVVDECQNTTPSQMLMCLTRIGEGSKFVFTGDPAQHDRLDVLRGGSGLVDFIARHRRAEEALLRRREEENGENERDWSLLELVSDMFPAKEDEKKETEKHVELFSFGTRDIQRHASIPAVLNMYGVE